MTLRVVFMGSPEFAVPILRELHSNFFVVGVITQSDKPRGRGRVVTGTPVKALAENVGIPVALLETFSTPEAETRITDWNPDVIVVAAYGKILPEWVLRRPRLGCVNVHASLLPRHRGASPIVAAIIAGDPHTGITTIVMDKGMDTGDVLLRDTLAISPYDTAGTLQDKLSELGAHLAVRTLTLMDHGRIEPVPQDHARATYCQLLRKSDGRINWSLGSEYLCRLVRGMNPWPGTHCFFRGETLKVWQAEPEMGHEIPGVVCAVQGDGILVGTGEGLINLRIVQAPARKRVTAVEFARGYRISAGSKFD